MSMHVSQFGSTNGSVATGVGDGVGAYVAPAQLVSIVCELSSKKAVNSASVIVSLCADLAALNMQIISASVGAGPSSVLPPV